MIEKREKKRVNILVDKEAWEGIQTLLRANKVQPAFFNELLNEFIRGQYNLLVGLMEKQKEKGKVTQGDLYQLFGQMIADLGKDEG